MGKAVGIDLLEDGERLGGQMGRRQAILNPKGTISAANRFIGPSATRSAAGARSARSTSSWKPRDVGECRRPPRNHEIRRNA
ncbi:MAG: hypothetical protein JWP56_2271 [Aeromicrobium sp.]|nr:hypothetical protein [Aeromicrobium sp.]